MISIIIPCFNADDHINACFNSLQNQTYQNFEILFINDGSTDNTLEVLQTIQKENTQYTIHIYTQTNHGVSHARNVGIKHARGKYIAFIDADDTVLPSFLQELYNGIQSAPLSVVGIGGNGFVNHSRPFTGIIEKEQFLHEFWLTHHLWGSNCNKLYVKSIIDKHQLTFDPQLTIMEDMYFNMCYCQYIDTIYVNNQLLYTYHYHSESTMHRSFTADKMNVVKTFEKLLQLPLNQQDRAIIELHQVNSLLWLLRLLYRQQDTDSLRQYETIILNQLKQANRSIFLKQGYKKGIGRYTLFLVYLISPQLYKVAIRLIYKFK